MRKKFNKTAYSFWGTKFPKKIRMNRTVGPDFWFKKSPPPIAHKGDEYHAHLNQNGAVFVRIGDETLGLRFKEFDVIETYDPNDQLSFDMEIKNDNI